MTQTICKIFHWV